MDIDFKTIILKINITNSTPLNMDAQGTELYDQNRGAFVDLSILDVLQIFGRAGRPQFDTSGTGIIITTHDKLNHYLKSMTNQFPIESNFINLLADHLNAEVWNARLGCASSARLSCGFWTTFFIILWL